VKENPIDKDNITETPNTIEYPHHRGSQIIKPEDVGKRKGRAVSAMEHQTDQQLDIIKTQMELLAQQAQKIQLRKQVSEDIYLAEMRFEPIINHTYHLYKKKDLDSSILSLIAPNNWGKVCPYNYVATVKLLADHTWDVLESAVEKDLTEDQ